MGKAVTRSDDCAPGRLPDVVYSAFADYSVVLRGSGEQIPITA